MEGQSSIQANSDPLVGGKFGESEQKVYSFVLKGYEFTRPAPQQWCSGQLGPQNERKEVRPC